MHVELMNPFTIMKMRQYAWQNREVRVHYACLLGGGLCLHSLPPLSHIPVPAHPKLQLPTYKTESTEAKLLVLISISIVCIL